MMTQRNVTVTLKREGLGRYYLICAGCPGDGAVRDREGILKMYPDRAEAGSARSTHQMLHRMVRMGRL